MDKFEVFIVILGVKSIFNCEKKTISDEIKSWLRHPDVLKRNGTQKM